MKNISVKKWLAANKVVAIFIVSALVLVSIWAIGTTRGEWSCNGNGAIPCYVKDNTSQPNSSSGLPFKVGERVTLDGKFVCLPHKDTSGPQTQECAYGIQTNSGTYYGIRDTTSNYSLLSKVGTGVPVRITGTYQKEVTTMYQSQGIIAIDSVTEIK